MKDLEQHLISNSIMKICDTVAHYVCKKKTKQLVHFFLTQYNDYYLNNNVLCLQFIHDRIGTLRRHSYSYTKRIVRVTICELFVLLAHLHRKPKIKLMTRKATTTCVFERPSKFPVFFRGKTISSTSYVEGIKHLCNLDEKHEVLFYHLLYSSIGSYNPEGITHALSELFRYKTMIKVTSLKKQNEMKDIDIIDNITAVLGFVCLSLCKDDLRRFHCKNIIDLLMIKPNFNMLLMAFNLMASIHFQEIYTTNNTFYLPVILQCSAKIEYIYEDLFHTEYKHLQKHLEKITLKSSATEDDFDPLFTIPEKKHIEHQITTYYKPENKLIVLKKTSDNNNIYNISKTI